MKKIICAVVMIVLAGCGQPGDKDSSSRQIAQKTFKTSDDFLQEGLAYLRDSDPLDAIKSFDEAIKREPNNPRGYLVLGQTYLRIGQYPRAIDTFMAAVHTAPQSGEIYYLLSSAYHLNGDYKEAFESVQKSIALFQQDKDEQSLVKSVALMKAILAKAGESPEEDQTKIE